MRVDTIEKLAECGIDVDNNGKLLQDKSVQLYQDGHLHDFGRGGKHYFNVDDFIKDRKDLHDAPVQANTSLKISTPKYNVEGIYNSYKIQFEQLDDAFKPKMVYDLIPASFWSDEIPKSIGYDFKNNSLTVSVFDGEEVKATTVRRSYDVKWRTYGKKTFIPTRLTGKDDVYLASGMGEIVLMDLMGWDYIGLQADGMVKHLQGTTDQIKHLIILPDNDKSFLDKVDEIVGILSPKTASIVRWEHPDPRDAATVYGTPEALQKAIDENLETIEIETVDDNAVGDMIELEHPKPLPINPIDFSGMVEQRLNELSPGFFVSEKMRDAFYQYGATYNEVVHRNTSGKASKRLIIAASTGSVKSVSIKLYLAKAKVSGLLVVKEISDAIDIAREINEMVGLNVAACHYTISSDHPDASDGIRVELVDLQNFPIAIISHSMFESRSDTGKDIDLFRTYKENQRACIAIDERINLMKEVSFGTGEIDDIVAILNRDERLDEIADGLKNINELIFKADKFNNAAIQYDHILSRHLTALSNHLIMAIEELRYGKYNIASKIRSRKNSLNDERENLIRALDRIAWVIADRYSHIVEGNNIVCSRSKDISGIFGSVVVLDATAIINKSYEYNANNRDDIIRYERPNVRRYDNVNLHICDRKGLNQSKTAIYSAPKKNRELDNVVDAYLEMLYPLVGADDKMLVATYKALTSIFEERCKYDNITFIHWGSGDQRGSNEFKDYNKAAAIGWYRMPAHIYAAMITSIVDTNIEQYVSSTGSITGDMNELKNSLIIDDMIQFFNRTRTRISIDENGNCAATDLYMFTGGVDIGIKSIFSSEMPGINFVKWEPVISSAIVKKKRSKLEENAEKIIAKLLSYAIEYQTISQKELVPMMGMSKTKISNATNLPLFAELAEESGIDITIKGRSKHFTIPKAFDAKLLVDKEPKYDVLRWLKI